MSNKLLIVDDEKDARDFLGNILIREGYFVKTAASGEEALELVKKEDFDAVLLDVVMSGMSGLEVLKKLRETKPDLIVILLTAIGYDQKMIDKCMEDGCSGYIGKSIPVSQIIASIKLFIESKKRSG
ncbi:MAG: response regulator [Candidatus Omnitrophica bacterium]|nr:response regulator [Candidatus Omnitrophota bacterium]MBU1870380.1 response regulator [Candidatus Omnitrophota bacterium]